MTRDPKSFDPRRGFSLDRRTFLSGSAAVALGGALSGPFASRKAMAQAAAAAFKPEDGASLRLLRWVPFVKGEEDAWNANTAAFTEATGVEVRIDQESWEDVRPKAAVAANVGSGPDIVMTWFDDPFQYPDKLVDVTDLGHRPGRPVRRLVRGPGRLRASGRHVHRLAALRPSPTQSAIATVT